MLNIKTKKELMDVEGKNVLDAKVVSVWEAGRWAVELGGHFFAGREIFMVEICSISLNLYEGK